MDEIMLSICVPTYNHEKYIVECLDSIRMQKTEYIYEVLVGEDASTDDTKRILQHYEQEHPGFLRVFYRKKNMSNCPIGNSNDLKRRATGKYIIVLEGDDFWTDEGKIQEQLDFLESNPEYIAVAHNCVVVGKDSMPNGEVYNECKDSEYTIGHFKKGIYPGQTASVMIRNYYKYNYFDTSFVDEKLIPGDKAVYFSLVSNSRVYCIQKTMSAYRHITTSGGSYSARTHYDYYKDIDWLKHQLIYAYRINKAEPIKCAEYLYAWTIRAALKRKEITLNEAIRTLEPVNNKFRAIFYVLMRDIRTLKTKMSHK